MNDTPRVVLVTGGTSGIGRATALAFARDGAVVAVSGRNAERGAAVVDELRAISPACRYIQADVSSFAGVERMVAAVVEACGRLDVAVNNAATFDEGIFKETAAFTEEEFDVHLAANLKSVWACMKFELEAMASQGRGAIVNVSSVNGLGGVPQNALYATAKAGVLALTKSAALEYAARGIRVNALVAGGFRTPMLEGVFSRIAPDDPAAVAQSYATMTPVQRIGDPAEAAAAILWLASDAASYVVGHSLIVDGGLTAPYR
jgi:NAD(P)-dependent dehydrogenase (short-subunit alcohol dehydrogenase family)